MIHGGVMDNFDLDENALTGIGGSHGTILMLFQNRNDSLDNATAQISEVSNSLFPKKVIIRAYYRLSKNNWER